MEIVISGEKALVKTPYNAEFVRDIKGIGGARWNRQDQCWEIPDGAVDACREIMMRVYGESDISTSEKLKIRLTFTADYTSDLRRDIVIMGKTLAHASGRDSGARPGDDVAYIFGKPRSGGSVKNWHIYIDAGTVVELCNVPAAVYENFLSNTPDGISSKVIKSGAVDIEALKAEREKLFSRIKEIDKILIAED